MDVLHPAWNETCHSDLRSTRAENRTVVNCRPETQTDNGEVRRESVGWQEQNRGLFPSSRQ
jgi:hypothetical protein